MELCPQCGVNMAMVGRAHRCVPRRESVLSFGAKVGTAEFRHVKKILANPTGPSPLILRGAEMLKRGRPRIGETRDKPWIAAGMSRATWYRRKAEKARK